MHTMKTLAGIITAIGVATGGIVKAIFSGVEKLENQATVAQMQMQTTLADHMKAHKEEAAIVDQHLAAQDDKLGKVSDAVIRIDQWRADQQSRSRR